jgi:hypothetical protein
VVCIIVALADLVMHSGAAGCAGCIMPVPAVSPPSGWPREGGWAGSLFNDRDTRLTWRCIICVAAHARMWHLIWLRWVAF